MTQPLHPLRVHRGLVVNTNNESFQTLDSVVKLRKIRTLLNFQNFPGQIIQISHFRASGGKEKLEVQRNYILRYRKKLV